MADDATELNESERALFAALAQKMNAFADGLTPDEKVVLSTIMGVPEEDVQTYSYWQASRAARRGDYAQQQAWTRHATNQWRAGDYWGAITSARRPSR